MAGKNFQEKLRVGVLSNPLSGRNKRNFSSYQTLFQSDPRLIQIAVVTPEDIAEALAIFAAREVNLILINGGDGTIQAALNTLLNDRPFPQIPWLAVFPSGTANMIAGDVGLGPFAKGTIENFIQFLAPSRLPLPIVKRNILRLRFADGRKTMYGMFFGAGAIYYGTQIGRATKQSVGRLGEWGAGLILAKFLVALATGSKKRLHSVPIGLARGKGDMVNQEYLVLLVTSLNRLFLGMKPFWSTETGPLHCTGLMLPYRHLWRCLPKLLRGKGHPLATKENGFVSYNPSLIRLQITSGFVLDGEIYDPPPKGQTIILEPGGEVSFVRLPS